MNKKLSSAHILVVDDELGMRELLVMELSTAGHEIAAAATAEEALKLMEKQKFDLVITDLKMPKMNGLSLLENIKRINPQIEVIVMTGFGTVDSAVEAMKKGAYDFVLKPFNIQEMLALVEKCVEKKDLKALVALYEASKAIFSIMEVKDLYEMIMNMVQNILGGDEGSLMLLDENGKLFIAASRGLSEEITRHTHIKIGERVAGRIAQKREPVLLIDGLEKYPEFQDVPSRGQIKSSIVCPLVIQEELLGVLNVHRTKRQENFTLSDLQSVSIFASQITLAIQNARLYQNLRAAYQQLEATKDQLVQSEKLASIGRLVAGVAHELNNPLTSVIGYSQLAIEGEIDPKEIRHQLSVIFEQAQRCNRIVRDLLLFSRRRRPEFHSVNLLRILDESIVNIQPELNKTKIQIIKNYPAEALNIEADANLLKQSFSNILVNASQALEEISGEKKIKISLSKTEEKIIIGFFDNGPGIPKDIQSKIFDPFFTTKDVGKGTGLGLSLAYGIFQEHGGNITVQSGDNGGTTFNVELPLKRKELSSAAEEPKPWARNSQHEPKRPPQIKRVLIVEDEEPIQRLIMTILQPYQYDFEVASDGLIALGKIQNRDYDLILCDYKIPKLDGIHFYHEVKKIKPAQARQFIFISGSTQFMQNSSSFFQDNHVAFLPKPFTREELTQAIEETAKGRS